MNSQDPNRLILRARVLSEPEARLTSTAWMLIIRDIQDTTTDVSVAGFCSSADLRHFLADYMTQHDAFVTEYWIYRDGEELEHVSE